MTYHVCWYDKEGHIHYGSSGLSESDARNEVLTLRLRGLDAWYEPDHVIA